MNIVWFLFATITVGDHKIEERVDAFRTPSECHLAAKYVKATAPDLTFECIGGYPNKPYASQPSWMTNEQAEKLRK